MADYTRFDNAVREIAPELQYSAEFVPLSKSRNAGGKYPTLNWKIRFSANTFVTISTDYQQGIAHLPGYDQQGFDPQSIDGDAAVRLAAESGYWNQYAPYNYTRGRAGGPSYGVVNLPAPSISEVLCCLLLDAEVLDYGTFDEWADNFGYDPDSRKAEKIYRDCLETGLKLRNMLGDDKLTRLREALQDI